MSDTHIKETDIYKVNTIDVSPQKQLTEENIVEYFETYIKQYLPFKEEPTYKAIISFIVKYYVDLIYNQQPALFKELFERQTVSSDLVDLLLVSIGMPENVIQSITTTTKFIILKSFSDFERYKGTVKFIRSIGGSLPDVMSYYELYIDYDENYVNPVAEYLLFIDKGNITPGSYFLISSNKNNYYIWFNYNNTNEDPDLKDKIGLQINYDDFSSSSSITKDVITQLNQTAEFFVNVNSVDVLEIQAVEHGAPLANPDSGTSQLDFKIVTPGKDKGSWILRPRPIFVHPRTDLVTEVFPYQAAYNKIPTLLIPEKRLEELKENNDLILPTKSNILLMDYTQSIDASYLNSIIFTILMENIGDDYFTVYLTGTEGTITTTYNIIIFSWYYILAKYYNVTMEGVDLALHIVMGTKKITDFVLEDIETIKKAYDAIETRNDIINFYNEYIDRFTRIYEADKPTVLTMSETLRRIDLDFWEYIENRISAAENPEHDLRFLLDEIYASLILSFEQYRDRPIIYKNIPVILQFLTSITTNIKSTDSYKLVYNLKPFHTELLDLAHNKIEVNNKFNALMVYDPYDISYLLGLADVLHLADETVFSFIPHGKTALSLNDAPVLHYKIPYTLSLQPNDDFNFSFLNVIFNLLRLSDRTNFSFIPKENETVLSLNDHLTPNFKVENQSDNQVKDSLYHLFLKVALSSLKLSDQANFLFTPKEKETILSLIDYLNSNSKLFKDSELNLVDELRHIFCLNLLNYLRISDQPKFLFTPKENETLLSFIDYCLVNLNDDNLKSDNKVKDSVYHLYLTAISSFLKLSDTTDFSFTPKEKENLLELMDFFKVSSINTKLKTSLESKEQIRCLFIKSFLTYYKILDKISFNFTPNYGQDKLSINSKPSINYRYTKTDQSLSWDDYIEIK